MFISLDPLGLLASLDINIPTSSYVSSVYAQDEDVLNIVDACSVPSLTSTRGYSSQTSSLHIHAFAQISFDTGITAVLVHVPHLTVLYA